MSFLHATIGIAAALTLGTLFRLAPDQRSNCFLNEAQSDNCGEPDGLSLVAQSDSVNPEIDKLIQDLGDMDFRRRQHASKRLEEIGVPALEGLQYAEEKSIDLETRKRAAILVKAIRSANNLPTRLNGAEFKLHVDSNQWTINAGALKKDVGTISLQMTNLAPHPRTFKFDGITLVLRDPKIEVVQQVYFGQRSEGLGPKPSRPLSTGETVAHAHCRGVLSLTKGKADIVFKEITSRSFGYRGLSKGVYALSIEFTNGIPALTDGSRLWTGSIATAAEKITITWEDSGSAKTTGGTDISACLGK